MYNFIRDFIIHNKTAYSYGFSVGKTILMHFCAPLGENVLCV